MGIAGGQQPPQFKRLNVQTLQIADTEVTATASQLNTVGADATALDQIATAFGSVDFERGIKIGTLAVDGDTLASAPQAWTNPEATGILVLRAVLRLTTASTGAATLNIGTTATSATTNSDTLLDGLDINSAAGVFDSMNDTDNGTNGVAKPQFLDTADWVTVTEASGAAEGAVGTLYIFYVVV